MARPAFAGRRARSRSGQLAAFAAVVLLVTLALAALGGAILPALDAGAREIVDQSGPTAAAARVDSRLSDDPGEQDATIRAAFDAALRNVRAEVVRSLSVDTEITLGDGLVAVQLLADPGAVAASELTAGAWPSGLGQVAIQDAAAAELGVSPGDALTIGERTVEVSGLWRALDPADPRWFGDPAIASGAEADARGPILVDDAVLADLPDTPLARWTLRFAPEEMSVTRLPAVADALARLTAEVQRMGGGDAAVSLRGSLDQSIARATRVTAVAAGVLGLPLVLVAVAGAIVLALIARSIAAGRASEFALLRARGGSLRALTGAAAREAGVAALVGAILGAALAVPALRFGLPLLGASGDASLLVSGVVAAGVVVLAVVLATTATVAQLRAPVTGRAESGRAALIAALGPLALVVVAAGLALAQFVSLGSPVLVRSDGVVRTDPVALTAPVLVLLAGALAAPVITGPIVALAERIARTGRGILPVLPLRQLARRTRSVAAGVLVTALAAGAVTVAAAFGAGAIDARRSAESAATGSDLRVQLPVRTSVEANVPAASAAVLEGVPLVDDVFAVLTTESSTGGEPVPLIAGDVERLAALPSAPAGLAAFAGELTAGRGGVAIPGPTPTLTIRAQLEPDPSIPADLDVDVLLWLADGDGSALRVPAGAMPVVAGPVELTVDIPPTATTILAVEFRPPQLEQGATIDVVLDEVRDAAGATIAFSGTSGEKLVSSKPARVLSQLPDTGPLPVVVGQQFADRFGLAPGTEFTFRIGSVPSAIPASVVGVLPVLPGIAGSLGIVLDLPVLENRAVELGGSIPAANELWVTTSDPDAAAASVRAVLTQRADLVTPRTLSPAPVLSPTIALLQAGVLVTVLLAILGFVAVASSIGQLRRVELTPLRSLGLTPGRIRSARAIELVATAILAVLLGVAAGLLTALLVVPGMIGVLG